MIPVIKAVQSTGMTLEEYHKLCFSDASLPPGTDSAKFHGTFQYRGDFFTVLRNRTNKEFHVDDGGGLSVRRLNKDEPGTMMALNIENKIITFMDPGIYVQPVKAYLEIQREAE